ncbi:uncharacterized protein N7498_007363 [Penicillium cinerascens]|uniref:NACHT domain-containing protein n=1 Tax=Penicillium cinerascens TaxID=70096 RepID=A0A9W9JLG7_9EURO|nr:uncharacterized protein N7498_007363 [Penicillium cinerascens]KAJ5198246.1 hypothetical protein N7498_007363 [Penicillium cinerascens]
MSPKKKRKLGSKVFWIYGNPGSGKTVLASFIVEELQNTTQDDQTHMFYFFFRQTHPTENHRAAAYRSLLCQIIDVFRHDEKILDIFSFAYENSSSGHTTATTNEMIELLQLCMSNLEGLKLLLDGIDECSDSEYLLEDLLQLNYFSDCKFLLLSRRNVPQLSRMVADDRQKEMERSLVSTDIARYLECQLERLVEDEMLPENADVSSLMKNLVHGADGMFLWANLMISYLRSPVLTPSRRCQTIKDIIMPEGLEAMYERIVGLIQSHKKVERDLASQVFMWLIYAKQRLNARQLRSVVMEHEGDMIVQERQASDFIPIITYACGGLVESRNAGADEYVDFIHLSAREYFHQVGGYSSSSTLLHCLIPPKEIANLYLTRKCFCELMQNPGLEVGLSSSFTGYAVGFAMVHLSETRGYLSTPFFSTNLEWQRNAQAMTQACRDFLQSPAAVSTWIERIYRYSKFMSDNIHSPLGLDSITTWIEWADLTLINFPFTEKLKSLVSCLKAFIADMQSLILHWDTKLKLDPTLIWDEVSAFLQSPFLQPSRGTTVSSLNFKQPDNNIPAASRSLCTISSTSSDCTQTGVLGIWPSIAFEERWGKLESGDPLSSMLHLCSGWTAIYEIWTKSKRKHRIQIVLEEAEISLLLRQSFREEFTDEWKTSFPLAISPSLASFIILRTVFTVDATSCRSTKIDMNVLESGRQYWDADLEPFKPQNETVLTLPPSLRQLHHDWYSYRFTFSPSEEYILFSHFVYHSEKQYLVIFRTLVSGKMQVVSALDIRMPFRHEHMFLSIFHPIDDLLITYDYDTLGAWEFRKGTFLNVSERPTSLTMSPSREFEPCNHNSQKWWI